LPLRPAARLLDLLTELLKSFQLCCIILKYLMAVRLRFGRFKEVLSPGFHCIFPIWVDEIISIASCRALSACLQCP